MSTQTALKPPPRCDRSVNLYTNDITQRPSPRHFYTPPGCAGYRPQRLAKTVTFGGHVEPIVAYGVYVAGPNDELIYSYQFFDHQPAYLSVGTTLQVTLPPSLWPVENDVTIT